MGYQKKDQYVTIVLFGVLVVATLGSMAVPFQAVSVVAIGLFEKTTGLSIKVFSYIFFCSGMASVFLIFICCYANISAGRMLRL